MTTSDNMSAISPAAIGLLKNLKVVHDQAVMTGAKPDVWEQAALRKIQAALDAYHETLHREWMKS